MADRLEEFQNILLKMALATTQNHEKPYETERVEREGVRLGGGGRLILGGASDLFDNESK